MASDDEDTSAETCRTCGARRAAGFRNYIPDELHGATSHCAYELCPDCEASRAE